MTTTSATSAGTTTSAATGKAGTSFAQDFDSFLKLLTAQLQNQDPLAPMDADKFTSQLVQFSGVEQAINTNTKLDTLIGMSSAGMAGRRAPVCGRRGRGGRQRGDAGRQRRRRPLQPRGTGRHGPGQPLRPERQAREADDRDRRRRRQSGALGRARSRPPCVPRPAPTGPASRPRTPPASPSPPPSRSAARSTRPRCATARFFFRSAGPRSRPTASAWWAGPRAEPTARSPPPRSTRRPTHEPLRFPLLRRLGPRRPEPLDERHLGQCRQRQHDRLQGRDRAVREPRHRDAGCRDRGHRRCAGLHRPERSRARA